MGSRRRRLLACALLACSVFFSGCVYLRLLELKNQLAKFDEYFELDAHDGLKVTFKKPVLRDEDLESFFGVKPESREHIGTADRWHFRFIKESAPEDLPGRTYEVKMDFLFTNHKLAKLVVPEELFALVPKSIAIAGMRGFGKARVDREKRSVAGRVEEQVNFEVMEKSKLLASLGQPVETKGTEERPEWRYRFRSASGQQRFGQIDMTFRLDAATGIVRHVRGVLIAGTMDFDLPDRSYSGATTFDLGVNKK